MRSGGAVSRRRRPGCRAGRNGGRPAHVGPGHPTPPPLKTSVSRRAALQGLGALGLGAVVPASVAAAPPARRAPHAGSSHRFTLGEAVVTVVRDAGFPLPPAAIGTNVAPEAVAALLDGYGLPTETVPTDVSVLVVDAGGVRTLVDTGTGRGDLVPTMTALGMGPETVDRVVVSHFHGDHVGGVSTDGAPTFPNASVHVAAAELAFLDGYSGTPEGAADGVAAAVAALAPVRNRLETYDDGDELAPGLRAVAAHGHTPGHMAFALASSDARMLIASDAVPHPVVFFRHPEWLFAFDMDPEPTVAARRALLDRAADEHAAFFASHLPFPGVGRVSRDGGGFRYTPTPVL